MQTITEKTIKEIKGNPQVHGRLMVAFNKSAKTIERWIESKDVRLTTATAVQIISEETGLSEADILEAESAAA